MSISEEYLKLIEDRIRVNSHMPISSDAELDEITLRILAYREEMFADLSIKGNLEICYPHHVVNELAKLFRVEAICVGLNLLPFHKALKFIAAEGMVNIGLNAITCVTVIAYAVTHW